MNDSPVEFRRGEFIVSTDRGRIAPTAALALLHSTFWGAGMDPEVLARAITNSVCFGLYRGEDLIGFGRVVTDLATYGYWTDVVIAADHFTRDAQSLYEGVGFTVGPGPLIYMEHRGS